MCGSVGRTAVCCNVNLRKGGFSGAWDLYEMASERILSLYIFVCLMVQIMATVPTDTSKTLKLVAEKTWSVDF